jgi:hypothetical protein
MLKTYLDVFRQQLLQVTGHLSVGIALLFFCIMLYNMVHGDWTFFGDGLGDLFAFGLVCSALTFMLSLYAMAIRHRLRFLFIPVILMSIFFLLYTPTKLKHHVGENSRFEDLMKALPKPQRAY